MDTTPHWIATHRRDEFPGVDRNLRVDVIVIGGGIAGVTAAYLLKKTGRTVALIERYRLGQGETGHTTAHLTYVTDSRLSGLVRLFGKDHAQAAWDAGLAAMQQIEANVAAESIECELRRSPGYLHTPRDGATSAAIEDLRSEAQLCRELGFEAVFVPSVPLVGVPGVRFANQLKFHPLKYLSALASKIPGDGSYVFEKSEATEFHEGPLEVVVNGHTISAEKLIIATHVPMQGLSSSVAANLLQTKLALYSTYAVGAKLPRDGAMEALWWDTKDPYDYLRIERSADGDYAIFGGVDHKTGQAEQTTERFGTLEARLKTILPTAEIDARWSGQVIEPTDGLPYIGPTHPVQFIGTGFAGNGMTFGTLTAMMARDWVIGAKNPWAELFDPDRKTMRASWDYLTENKDYPFYLLKDRFTRPAPAALAEIPNGSGCVLKIDGHRVAASRSADGELTTLSAVCPHMGCIVHWNDAEKTWDCPCHGSRFTADGNVIGGPAEKGLEKAQAVGSADR